MKKRRKVSAAKGITGDVRKEWAARIVKGAALCLLIAGCAPVRASASGAQTVTSGLKNLRDIVAFFVHAVGVIIVLWGILEWGNTMQSQDGMMQFQTLGKVIQGTVMIFGPPLGGIAAILLLTLFWRKKKGTARQ